MRNFIKEYRQSSGFTQSDLAFILGVSKNTVSSWECNKFQPSADAISQLLQLFDVDFFDLFLVPRLHIIEPSHVAEELPF